jgi:hypothetical protein
MLCPFRFVVLVQAYRALYQLFVRTLKLAYQARMLPCVVKAQRP